MTFAKEDSNLNAGKTAEDKSKVTTDAIAGAGKRDAERLAEESQRAVPVRAPQENRGAHLEPLFDSNVDHDFRDRWHEIQTGFVDEPRRAVKQADELVAELMQRLAQGFSAQRSNLEQQWDASNEVSTEELRVALTRYRSFFERLISA